jgi:ferredoxin
MLFQQACHSNVGSGPETLTIKWIHKDGKETSTPAAVGASLLEVAHRHGIELEGACEGVCACSTCHVILQKQVYDTLPEPSEEEDDMLDRAFGLTATSRLGCQIKLQEEHNGLIVKLPKATRNFYVVCTLTSHVLLLRYYCLLYLGWTYTETALKKDFMVLNSINYELFTGTLDFSICCCMSWKRRAMASSASALFSRCLNMLTIPSSVRKYRAISTIESFTETNEYVINSRNDISMAMLTNGSIAIYDNIQHSNSTNSKPTNPCRSSIF